MSEEKKVEKKVIKRRRAVVLNKTSHIRWSNEEYARLEEVARVEGYSNVAEMIRRIVRAKVNEFEFRSLGKKQ